MKISTRVRYGLKALVYIADKSSENKSISFLQYVLG